MEDNGELERVTSLEGADGKTRPRHKYPVKVCSNECQIDLSSFYANFAANLTPAGVRVAG